MQSRCLPRRNKIDADFELPPLPSTPKAALVIAVLARPHTQPDVRTSRYAYVSSASRILPHTPLAAPRLAAMRLLPCLPEAVKGVGDRDPVLHHDVLRILPANTGR